MRKDSCRNSVCSNVDLSTCCISLYFYITDAGQERIDAFLDEWDEVKRIYAFIKGEEV